MEKLVNYTPHDLRVRFDPSNEAAPLESDLVLPSKGRGFISTKSEKETTAINGIPCVEIEYGSIEGLPDPEEGTIFIVSMPAAQYLAALGRTNDIRYPDTGKAEYCVRTEKGQPFATRRLLQAKVK